MNFSVVIPAYNAAATLRETIDSALAQTHKAQEILVFNDGSTDETDASLQSYGSAITVFTQPNGGVARARNFMCARVTGDLVAFLDADDVWHPRYLEIQHRQLTAFPQAVAAFSDHTDLAGYGHYSPDPGLNAAVPQPTVYEPRNFISSYDASPLRFQMSGCCVRRSVLETLGPEPFFVGASGADDTYFHNLLPLLGPVVHAGIAPFAYRIITSSISANRLKMALLVDAALGALEEPYRQKGDLELLAAFKTMVASRKRNCGKYLMGAGQIASAREKFHEGARAASSPVSKAKSLSLLVASHLPKVLQPKWPGGLR